jgi:CBS-domain-containing membrane protein
MSSITGGTEVFAMQRIQAFGVRLLGAGAMAPPVPPLAIVLLGSLGCSIAILATFLLGRALGSTPVILASLGASCFLAFCVPASPLAQPRAILGGHLATSLAGFLSAAVFADPMIAATVGVGLGAAAMLLGRCGHPPAGANPIIIALTQPGLALLWTVVLPGALAVTAVALIFNALRNDVHYPQFWTG